MFKPGQQMQGEINVPGAAGNLAAGLSFPINRTPGALGGRTGEQLKRIYQGGTQENKQLNDELLKRGIMPGSGPQLPQVFNSLPGAVGNMGAMLNAGLYGGPQLGMQVPQGFQNKFVS